jgi:hypothetical protein
MTTRRRRRIGTTSIHATSFVEDRVLERRELIPLIRQSSPQQSIHFCPGESLRRQSPSKIEHRMMRREFGDSSTPILNQSFGSSAELPHWSQTRMVLFITHLNP